MVIRIEFRGQKGTVMRVKPSFTVAQLQTTSVYDGSPRPSVHNRNSSGNCSVQGFIFAATAHCVAARMTGFQQGYRGSDFLFL